MDTVDGKPRVVRLFRNGANQALRIPRDLELPGNEAVITREGDALVIRPLRQRSLRALLATLGPIEESIAQIDELPIEPVDV